MKPDNTTPGTGSIESAPKPDSLNVHDKLEAKNDVKVESQPIVGASVPPQTKKPAQTLQAAASQSDNAAKATDDSDDHNNSSFENKLHQLEASSSSAIESHWVEAAEDVMEKTAEDPYYEDDAQHALSKAYLKKRFGLIIE